MSVTSVRSRTARRPIIGVMGSHRDAHRERSTLIGEWIARRGYHLLTGGGGGVMEAVSQAFVEVRGRPGCAIGIIPTRADRQRRRPLAGYPNPWVEIAIYGQLDAGGARGDEPSSRNHVNVLSSTVLVVLPGGAGTASEARLALRYQTPCVAFLRSRDEVPDLPPEIVVEARFEGVTEFVERHTQDW